MAISIRARTLLLFVAAYAGYAATLWLHAGSVTSTAFLLLMIAAVVWAHRRTDEVLQAAANRGYQFGFWVGFLTLYLDHTLPRQGLGNPWPIWTAPLAAWILGYGWSIWRNR